MHGRGVIVAATCVAVIVTAGRADDGAPWLDLAKLRPVSATHRGGAAGVLIGPAPGGGVLIPDNAVGVVRACAILERRDAGTGSGHGVFVSRGAAALIERAWIDSPGLDTNVRGQRHGVYLTVGSTATIRNCVFSRTNAGFGAKVRGVKVATIEDTAFVSGCTAIGGADVEQSQNITLRRVLVIGSQLFHLKAGDDGAAPNGITLGNARRVVLDDVWIVQPAAPRAGYALEIARDVEAVTGTVHLVGWTANRADGPVKRRGHDIEVVTHALPQRDGQPIDLLAELGGIDGVVRIGPVEALTRIRQWVQDADAAAPDPTVPQAPAGDSNKM